MIYLLLKGKLPSKNEVKMLGAVLVSLCEHKSASLSIQSAKIAALSGSSLNECIAEAF
jgi:citrate synthase